MNHGEVAFFFAVALRGYEGRVLLTERCVFIYLGVLIGLNENYLHSSCIPNSVQGVFVPSFSAVG